ncbi:unnamed protein product, partial [Trichogramma brassicae]
KKGISLPLKTAAEWIAQRVSVSADTHGQIRAFRTHAARTSSPHISRKKKGKRRVREYESYTKLLNSQPQDLVVQICVQAGIVSAAAAAHNNASLRFTYIRPTLTTADARIKREKGEFAQCIDNRWTSRPAPIESPSPIARKTLRRATTRVLLSCGRIYKYSCKLGDEKDIFKNASAYGLTTLAARVLYSAVCSIRCTATCGRADSSVLSQSNRGQKRSIVVHGVAINVYAHTEANSAILVGRRQRKSTLGSLFEFGYRENISNQKKRKKKKEPDYTHTHYLETRVMFRAPPAPCTQRLLQSM